MQKLVRMNKFEKLGLSSEIVKALSEINIVEPSEIQEKTIKAALEGRDIIGGSATGSGKTLAFAAPIIQNLVPNEHVQALILTPTRELAEQISSSFKAFSKYRPLEILSIYGGVDIERQIKKLKDADVVIATPGRMLDHISRRTIRLDKIRFLVLDEVDRMFDMGFYKDVRQIIERCGKERQTMMFSATISADLDYLAQKYTKNPLEVSVESYVDPTKLKQIYYDVPDFRKFSLLVHLLKNENANLVMVFCGTKGNVDFVAHNLSLNGIHAKAIHGGLPQTKRTKVLEEFNSKNRMNVLVCTDVAARGLDIKGVSHVYNYDIPNDPKDYIHRIGRTARAGKDGIAINILSSRDYLKFGKIQTNENLEITSVPLPNFPRVRIEIIKRKIDRKRPKNSDFAKKNKRFSRRKKFK